MNLFYVINYNINKKVFEPHEILEYLTACYKKSQEKPSTLEEFKKFVERKSMYRFWSRCEYEIILKDWPCQETEVKWDIHRQIMMNIDVITKLLMENVHKK